MHERRTTRVVLALAATVGAASAPAATPLAPRLTGAFIQLNGSLASRSAAAWQAELDAMAGLGMDTVVVQYSAFDNAYFYPTSIPGKTPSSVDALERILDAADQNAMQVYLGLHLDSTQDGPGAFNLAANLAQGQATLQELATRYGSHSSLAGWYGPQEISDYIALDPSQTTLRNNLVTYVHDLADLGRSATGLALPTMISPYFGQNPNGAAYAQWWNATGLPGMDVDIVAMQDGVGTHRTTIAQSQTVFAAVAPVMAQHGVAFWSNNESFNQIHGWPVDNLGFQAVPTSAATLNAQVVSTAPFVEKSITFEFSHYMSPQGSAAAQNLYNGYQAIVTPTTSQRLIPLVGYAYDNSPTTFFNASATDPGLARLRDGVLGSTTGGPGSAFANGTWVGYGDDGPDGGPQPRLVLDLGGAQLVDAVEVTYLVDALSSIFAPQPVTAIAEAVTLESSIDGFAFSPVASTSDFVPSATDNTAGAFERRTVRFDLNGLATSHLALDVRTPHTWIFLGEVQVFEAVAAADFNADGFVDGADLALWTSGFGASSNPPCGDADGDGDADGADLLIWQQQVAISSSFAAASVVAEPLAGSIAAIVAIGAFCRGGEPLRFEHLAVAKRRGVVREKEVG